METGIYVAIKAEKNGKPISTGVLPDGKQADHICIRWRSKGYTNVRKVTQTGLSLIDFNKQS